MLLPVLPTLLAAALLVATGVPPAPTGVVDLDGRPVNPLDVGSGGRATVLIFTTTDCPISNRYAPEVARLDEGFRDRGVAFWLVYPVPGDTPEKIREHTRVFGYGLPVARDTGFALVRRTGVTVTPEVAVIDASGTMVYRGRIDDRYVDFGLDRPAPTTHDLEAALTSLLAGHPIEPKTTRAVGCILSDLLK
ncbi:MAG: redoxin domain-containing protein [Acidobacteriota bacterium]|nr:redoxin domain-containing protein [Acidobacteriota bacterium]